MTSLFKFLKNHQGNMIELPIMIAFLSITFAITIPSLLDFQKKSEVMLELRHDFYCLINQMLYSEGDTNPDIVCPLTDRPYEIQAKDGREMITCPNPKKHMLGLPELVKKGDTWLIRQDVSRIGLKPGKYSLASSKGKLDLIYDDHKIILKYIRESLSRFIVGPLLLVFGAIFTILSIMWTFESIKDILGYFSKTDQVKQPYKRNGSVGEVLWAIFLLLFFYSSSFHVTRVALKQMISKSIDVSIPDKTITLKRTYFGMSFSGQHILQNIITVTPVKEKGAFWVLFKDKEDHLRHKTIFIPAKDMKKLTSMIHRALLLSEMPVDKILDSG